MKLKNSELLLGNLNYYTLFYSDFTSFFGYTNKVIGSLTTSRSGLQSAILDILFVFTYIKEGE